jgi:hypothetical protein
VDTLNEGLRDLYDAAWPVLRPILLSRPLISCPLFMRAPPSYGAARVPWMAVGQETKGWGIPTSSGKIPSRS